MSGKTIFPIFRFSSIRIFSSIISILHMITMCVTVTELYMVIYNGIMKMELFMFSMAILSVFLLFAKQCKHYSHSSSIILL